MKSAAALKYAVAETKEVSKSWCKRFSGTSFVEEGKRDREGERNRNGGKVESMLKGCAGSKIYCKYFQKYWKELKQTLQTIDADDARCKQESIWMKFKNKKRHDWNFNSCGIKFTYKL